MTESKKSRIIKMIADAVDISITAIAAVGWVIALGVIAWKAVSK